MKIIERDGKCRIYYSYKGKVARFSTGVNFKEKNTIQNKQILQSKIARIQDIINKHIMVQGEKPTVDYINEQLAIKNVSSTDLLGYYQMFLEWKHQDITVKTQSEKDYVSLMNALIDYQRDHQHLYLSSINSQFMINFTNYLSKKREKDQKYLTQGGLNDNTIRKRLSSLRTFFHWLAENKYYEIPKSVMKYQIEKYDTPFVTLSDEDLHKLWYEYKNPKFEKVRDILIFACMTSLRYSDIITLEKNRDIKDDIIIKISNKSRKDKEKYVVKLNAISKAILEKYEYNLSDYTDQYFNRQVKLMAKDCGYFDYSVKFSVYRGGIEVTEEEFMWNMISAHTGRRTFITRCIQKGVPISEVMIMSSHKKIDTLMKYLDKRPNEKINFVDRLLI